MIKATREGQEYTFENSNELLVFLVEKSVFKEDLDEAKAELRAEIASTASDIKKELRAEIKATEVKLTDEIRATEIKLKDEIAKSASEIKLHTATLLRNKEIISKDEGLEYIRTSV